ncbi:hypothetical protein B0T24DRAFT_689159 [Lasiosphaeria ovina]|uniref:Heterokaryon incompatibility domain-containing protein n=1 Tax=Lasiosphaeria ovina TaxID=92902 RepID=A0AAE0NMA0_9PEZI|nr:hypothetical protein B0T24DRAFT_689159 [Lasiosphaeria ovina]
MKTSIESKPEDEGNPRLSEEPTTAGKVSTRAICENCRNLNPDDPEFGDLFLSLLQFIYNAAASMVPSFASGSQIHASVKPLPKHDRIDLSFGGRLSMQIYSCRSTPQLFRGCRSPHEPWADLTDTSSDDSFEFVLNCLQHCKQNHPKCSQRSPTFQPSRLIRCADINGQYVALSYCWGSANFFKMTRANIYRLKQGFSLSDLPRTLQGAIRVTRQLGVSYIWIDALCIIQGFLNLKRNPVRITRTRPGGDGVMTVLVAHLQNDWSPVMGTQDGDFDPVQKRGWWFQEEILSRRFVAFSRHEIQWSCRTESGCQCRLLDRGPRAIPHTQSLPDDPFRFWAEMLPFYTQRSLRFPSDVLPGISGLAREIQRITSTDYVAGIWLHDLKRSLDWKPQDDITACPSTYRAPSFSWASIDSPIFMRTAADFRPGVASVVSWDVQPRGQGPFGEVKYASLTLSGFVCVATITRKPESFSGFEYRVAIADRSAVLDEDTYLVKFQTKDLVGRGGWSVRRSQEEVKQSHEQWGPGVAVQALCLSVEETAVEFLVLGQCPYDVTKLERIGTAIFTTAISSFKDFAGECLKSKIAPSIFLRARPEIVELPIYISILVGGTGGTGLLVKISV